MQILQRRLACRGLAPWLSDPVRRRGRVRGFSADRLATRTSSPLLGTDVVERDSGELSRADVGASITRSTRTSVSRDLLNAGWGRSQLRAPGYYHITVVGAARDPRGLNALDYELAVEVIGEASGQGAWEPVAIEQAGLQAAQASSGSWLPTGAQLGAFLGGVAVARAGFAAWWLLRRRRA